jgi:hypothetical protein
MSTLTRTRRMPAKYRVRPGGITEIVYDATPELVPVLPGTRWLEQRREREARLAAEAALLREVADIVPEPAELAAAPLLDTELAEMDFEAEDQTEIELDGQPDEMTETESLSWTDRMRVASTRLIRRQNPCPSSLNGGLNPRLTH